MKLTKKMKMRKQERWYEGTSKHLVAIRLLENHDNSIQARFENNIVNINSISLI